MIAAVSKKLSLSDAGGIGRRRSNRCVEAPLPLQCHRAPHAELTAAGAVMVLGPRCVGMVSQTISDDAGGQFAAVVPSRVIRRLLSRV